MKRLAVSVFFAAMAGICFAQDVQTPATDAQLSALKVGSERTLKDAPSAIYRDVSVIDKGDGMIVLCGMVNAKNSMGGYSGFQRFMAYGNMKRSPITAGVAFLDDGDPPGKASIMCRANGFSF